MRVIAALAIVLFSLPALAVDVTVSWTHPTQYTDNTPLTPENIRETQVQYGSCTTATTPTFGTMTAELVIPAPAATAKFVSVLPARHCFRARTADTQLRYSSWSTVVAKTVVDIKPKPPVIN